MRVCPECHRGPKRFKRKKDTQTWKLIIHLVLIALLLLLILRAMSGKYDMIRIEDNLPEKVM